PTHDDSEVVTTTLFARVVAGPGQGPHHHRPAHREADVGPRHQGLATVDPHHQLGQAGRVRLHPHHGVMAEVLVGPPHRGGPRTPPVVELDLLGAHHDPHRSVAAPLVVAGRTHHVEVA